MAWVGMMLSHYNGFSFEMEKYGCLSCLQLQLYCRKHYVVNTLGLSHNHGGTAMFIEYGYNGNISKNNYFNVL